ncbi:hypothetical protein GQR58_028533 [Nymphon striatum]|nr:hypothetical protein GQR58_028533 [Nymphon striatum]
MIDLNLALYMNKLQLIFTFNFIYTLQLLFSSVRTILSSQLFLILFSGVDPVVLWIEEMEHAHADGILDAIWKALEKLDVYVENLHLSVNTHLKTLSKKVVLPTRVEEPDGLAHLRALPILLEDTVQLYYTCSK